MLLPLRLAFPPVASFSEKILLAIAFWEGMYSICSSLSSSDHLPGLLTVAVYVFSSSCLLSPSSQLLTYLNYRGLTIVGYTAIALTVLGLLPFLVLTAMALPMIQPKRWSGREEGGGGRGGQMRRQAGSCCRVLWQQVIMFSRLCTCRSIPYAVHFIHASLVFPSFYYPLLPTIPPPSSCALPSPDCASGCV